MISSYLIRIFKSDLDLLKNEISAYQEEDTLWLVPESISNSAGNLALHLIGNLNHFIGTNLGDSDYKRNRPAEFANKNVERNFILAKIDETTQMIERVVSNFDDNEMNMLYPVKFNDRDVTIGYMLTHLSAHLNYHLGQINYHRRLLTN